jgi:hypothetical protein
MSQVNESIYEFRDGVFIGGNNPPPHTKPMTKTELTLDQLTAISGGVQMGPDGSICTDRHIMKAMEISKRLQKILKGNPAPMVGGSPDPGGDDI